MAPGPFFTHVVLELLLLAIPVGFATIAIHESAHAWFALRGSPSPGRIVVAIGCVGPRLVTLSGRRFEVQIGLYPRRGFVRWNQVGMTVGAYRRSLRAGPLANIAVGLPLGLAAMAWSHELGMTLWLLLIYAAAANVTAGVLNLRPRIIVWGGQTHYTDGYHLAAALGVPDDELIEAPPPPAA